MNARTLSIFRLYQLFNGIIFTGPIWAVYLLSRGFSLTQFGVVEACLHIGMLSAQVPTGALADALGRRRLLVAAGFFTAVGELGYVYAPGFLLVCVAGAVHGVAFALRSGADEAYLFDSLAHDDAEAQFPRMLGGMWAVFQLAGAVSFLAGGAIAHYWSRPLAFWLTAGCALVASFIATRLPDDASEHSAGHSVRVAARGLVALRRSPRLAVLTVAWSVYWAGITTWWFYAAPFFERRGASDLVLGLVLGAAMLAGSGMSWLSGRLSARVSVTVTVAACTAGAVIGLILGPALPGLASPIVVMLLVAGLPDAVYVTLSSYLQRNTRSEFRATSMSIAEAVFSIQMLWLFPLVGWIVQNHGYRIGYGLCAGLIALAGGMFIASQWLPGLDDATEPVAVGSL